jgi:hypothetical protein
MSFDTEKFATYLRTHAKPHSATKGDCAKWVRLALEAAGADTRGHPASAKDYGPTLTRNGFHAIKVEDPDIYHFLKGDIAVIQPTEQGNPAGHIAGYDGRDWISDFVQWSGFWPGPAYKKENPDYVVYRH